MASSEAVEVIWAEEEDLEAASTIRDSASLSEMKESEKMTSYYGVSVRWNTWGLTYGLTWGYASKSSVTLKT